MADYSHFFKAAVPRNDARGRSATKAQQYGVGQKTSSRQNKLELPRVAPPSGLRGARFEIDGEEYAVLAFPTELAQPPALTLAEQAVAQLALNGFANEEIAAMRGASTRTVANQLQSIYRKLGVGSRVELARALANVDLGLSATGRESAKSSPSRTRRAR